MTDVKISCLSTNCPERTGGLCQFDPRSPIRTPEQKQARKEWQKVQEIITEHKADPAKCLKVLLQYAGAQTS